MTRKKTSDPKLIALMDERAKLQALCERSYARMKRAFNRLEKCRKALARISKRIDGFAE